MNREELKEKLNELLEDPQFVDALSTTKSAEDMARLLGEYGVNVTAEELESLVASVPATGELSEEDLEAVAGGNAATGLVLLLMRKHFIPMAVAIVCLCVYRFSQLWR